LYKNFRENGLKDPNVYEEGRFFKFIFFRSTDTGKTPEKEIDSEEIIIKYLNENESIDNKKARAETGLTADGVKSLFRKWQKSYYKKGIRQKHLLYKKIKYL